MKQLPTASPLLPPPHCCQACHQHWCVYMCVYVCRAGIDQGPQCCAFVALFPGSSPLPLWWWDLVMVPFGSPTPPLLPISSSLLLSPQLLPHSLAPRLSPHTSFLPLTSFHPPLPPRHWVEWEQPALSKHKDRSCQQVAMATASLSPSRHVPAR